MPTPLTILGVINFVLANHLTNHRVLFPSNSFNQRFGPRSLIFRGCSSCVRDCLTSFLL